MLIETRPPTDPELAALVTAQQRERGGTDEVDPMPTARYAVVVVDGRAVACGAVRVLDAQTAELMRMYVRPAYRGRGVARRLLTALEELALAGGQPVVRLEAGEFRYSEIAFYTAAGYAPVPAYGANGCFEKRLSVPIGPPVPVRRPDGHDARAAGRA